MSLRQKFTQQIAAMYGVSNLSNVGIDSESITIGSHSLPLVDVFFKGVTIPSQSIPLFDYLDRFLCDPDDNRIFREKLTSSEYCTVIPLRVENEMIQHGFHILSDTDGTSIGTLFTGKFASSHAQPDLTEFRDAILAVCAFDPISGASVGLDWHGLFESFGAFAICNSATVPYGLLAESGLFSRDTRRVDFSWSSWPPQTMRKRQDGIPDEAERAYIEALSCSGGPDIAFTRLYRVMEVLFAFGLKAKVNGAKVNEVLRIFREFKDLSELKMLTSLLDGKSCPFTSFTLDDFKALYKSHRPDQKYDKLGKWLDNSKQTCFPNQEVIPSLIYYVRCSLVHSKLDEKEPFLLGPFTHEEHVALQHITEDLRDIVRSLIY
jgi:hypothetical protein